MTSVASLSMKHLEFSTVSEVMHVDKRYQSALQMSEMK